MKFSPLLILGLVTLPVTDCYTQASSQLVDCNNCFTTLPCSTWGKADWSGFEAYDEQVNPGVRTGARIREYDYNIESTGSDRIIYSYYGDELVVRWFLEDTTILYEASIIPPFYKLDVRGCAVVIVPDSLLQDMGSKMVVAVERKNARFQWGLEFRFEQVSPVEKALVEEELDGCESLDCHLDVLLSHELYIDALTVLEKQALISKSDQLVETYWQLANQIRIKVQGFR